MTDTLLCFYRTMIPLLFTQISMSVMNTQIHVMVILPAAMQRVAMTVNVMLVTQEMDSHAQVSTVKFRFSYWSHKALLVSTNIFIPLNRYQ